MRSRFEQLLSLSAWFRFRVSLVHGLEFNLKFGLAVRAGDDLTLLEFVFGEFDLARAIRAFGQQAQQGKLGRIEAFNLEFGPAILADQHITDVKRGPFLGRHFEFFGADWTGDQERLIRFGLIGLRLCHGDSPSSKRLTYSPGNF
jgi:hypothetical protein